MRLPTHASEAETSQLATRKADRLVVTPLLIEYDALLSREAEALVTSSGTELSQRPEIWHDRDNVVAKVLRLRGLDRLGGVEGHGGSRVFVGRFEGETRAGSARSSVPLLLKVVERNRRKAAALLRERDRYEDIQRFLDPRDVARCFAASRAQDAAVLWTEFFGDAAGSGMPVAAPKELRHEIEKRHWGRCEEIIRATYDILRRAHTSEAVVREVDFITEYNSYLRLDRGYGELAKALGSAEEVSVLGGVRVRNPCEVLRKLQMTPFRASARCAAVHGDLHPRNVMAGRNHKACLIDWAWAQSDNFPVIVDFVLMELSVRFFYLPWRVNRAAVALWEPQLVANWREPLRVGDEYIDGATRLTHAIRRYAEPYITHPNDPIALTTEYFLPLFLLTMGTFAFASSVANLDHLILSAGLLAERVERDLGL